MTEARLRAPELPTDLEWFNTPSPLRLADLRGTVVLLDFWTYSCINCLHVQPDLHWLQERYPEQLTVIGIHSPKFPNEEVAPQVRKAIHRHHIRHPVANDPTLQVWRQYAIRAWPSLILIDPEGYVLGVLRGEGHREQLDGLLRQQLAAAERKGVLRPAAVTYSHEREPTRELCFPGKVHATPHRVYVSDSGHNRILEMTPQGRVVRVFGSPAMGLVDGGTEYAAFNNPQGLVRMDDYLFVADTDNHAIRRIALRPGEVETVAGTGKLGRSADALYENPLQAPLNSPWDVAYQGGVLYIAMAGRHQIWAWPLSGNLIKRFAGNGREALQDGGALEACFAQPSGLSMADHRLLVADAESSAVRSVSLPDGRTETLIGKGLFEFGDEDGNADSARLQHPLAIAHDPVRQRCWICDTFNHQIRYLDYKSKSVYTVPCSLDLNEPGGLSLCGDALWVTNSNQHQLVVYDIATDAWRVVDVELDL